MSLPRSVFFPNCTYSLLQRVSASIGAFYTWQVVTFVVIPCISYGLDLVVIHNRWSTPAHAFHFVRCCATVICSTSGQFIVIYQLIDGSGHIGNVYLRCHPVLFCRQKSLFAIVWPTCPFHPLPCSLIPRVSHTDLNVRSQQPHPIQTAPYHVRGLPRSYLHPYLHSYPMCPPFGLIRPSHVRRILTTNFWLSSFL